MRRQPLRSQRRRPESSLRSFPARFVRPSLLVSLCLIMWAAASSLALADGSVAPPLFGGDPSRHTGAQSPGGPGLIGGGVGASGSSLATHEVDGYRLYVVVSESVILNARNVQRVAVADPAIADVAVATHTEVLINGVSPGRTTLHVWDAQGRTSFAIRVYEDAAEMAREIEHRIADPGVFVWVVKGSVILEGEVADPVARERAVKIAGAYSERVIDLLRAPTPDVASMRAEAVREALDDPRIRVTVINETILIEGIVDSPQEKERASAVARAFGHPVVDLVRVREAHASDALDQVVQEAIGDPSVRVSLHGEILVLEGTVHTELQRRRAETLAKAYADRVESFIEVQPAEPLTDSFDPLRPSLRDEIVRAIANPAIHVHIFGDTVFLEGRVNEEHAKERAKAIALAFHDKVVDLLRIDELAVPALAPTLLTPPSSTGEGAGIGVNTDSDTGTATDVGPGAGDRSGVTTDLRLDAIVGVGAAPDPLEESKRRLAALAEMLGEPNMILSSPLPGTVVLDGLASSSHGRDRAERLARIYFADVINVARADGADQTVQPALADVVAEAIGREGIEVRAAGGRVILEGQVDSQNELERVHAIAESFGAEVISFVEVRDPIQVLIEMQVVEVETAPGHELGLTWGAYDRGIVRPHEHLAVESPMGGPLIRMLPFAAQIHTLVTAGHARLLAQPSLLTMSGETANFLAGGEIPVAIPQDGGRVLVEWKPYGVMLEVTPIVDTQGRVEVAIVAEASTLDWENGIRLNNLLIPALGVRRTESRLRINDGETLVMGGLIRSVETRQIEKFPLLGDLPIIGKLFSSEQFSQNETELLIIVTPHVIRIEDQATLYEVYDADVHEEMRRPIPKGDSLRHIGGGEDAELGVSGIGEAGGSAADVEMSATGETEMSATDFGGEEE